MSVIEQDILMNKKEGGNIAILYPTTKAENVLCGNNELLSTILASKEEKSNKVSSLSSSNTNTQYVGAKAIYDAIQKTKVKYINMTLLSTGWVLNNSTYYYEYTISNSNITTNTLVNGYLDIPNQEKLTGSVYIQSYNGGFKVITNEEVTENVTITFTYLLTGGV